MPAMKKRKTKHVGNVTETYGADRLLSFSLPPCVCVCVCVCVRVLGI